MDQLGLGHHSDYSQHEPPKQHTEPAKCPDVDAMDSINEMPPERTDSTLVTSVPMTDSRLVSGPSETTEAYDWYKSSATGLRNIQSCSVIPDTSSPDDLMVIAYPKKFFKKGRIFATPWSEPRGIARAEWNTHTSSEEAFTEMARFVVLKPKSTHSICVRIHTYSGQATTKHGITVTDHVAIVAFGRSFEPHPKEEQGLMREALIAKIENDNVEMHSNSRINFGKPYTVEHNLKVQNIGRLVADSVQKLDEYFAESIGLKPMPTSSMATTDEPAPTDEPATTDESAPTDELAGRDDTEGKGVDVNTLSMVVDSGVNEEPRVSLIPGAQWMWSGDHNDYYLPHLDQAGNMTYRWASQSDSKRVGARTQHVATGVQSSSAATPQTSVPMDARMGLRNFISGTSSYGWYEALDPTYRMRTGAEARSFFQVGRVFSMLFTEAAGATSRHSPDDDAFTVVRYGETAHTQIRRFVVVSVRKFFVLACAISNYGRQGTLKKGCDPSEHAIIYPKDAVPVPLPGEIERGLSKEPIEFDPVDSSIYLPRESRIRFGKVYSIEWNVKVKDIGRVVRSSLGALIRHYREEEERWGKYDL